MRLGFVTGVVVLSRVDAGLCPSRFLIVRPVSGDDLASKRGTGSGRELVVADHLGPGIGSLIAFVEGREGANPYYPGLAAVDAYCSLIVENVDYRPPQADVAEQHA